MKREVNSINLLFPVLNERLRLQKGIEATIAYVREHVKIPCRLTILDNDLKMKLRRLERNWKKLIGSDLCQSGGERRWRSIPEGNRAE